MGDRSIELRDVANAWVRRPRCHPLLVSSSLDNQSTFRGTHHHAFGGRSQPLLPRTPPGVERETHFGMRKGAKNSPWRGICYRPENRGERASIDSPQSKLWTDLTANPPDRVSGKQSARNLGIHSIFEEHVTADKLVVTRDPLPYRPIPPRRTCEGHQLDYSDDSRVSILAQVHHLDARKLDSGIQ